MGKFEQDLVKPYLKTHRVLVESGTLYGAGVDRALPYFDAIYTIELDKKLHVDAQMRFWNNPKVTCLQGDSKEVLHKLIPELPVTGVVFYLDAHWSGDKSVDWKKSSWKGYVETSYVGNEPTPENQVPLLGELQAIVEKYPGPAILYIDDMDKFDEKGHGRKDFKFVGEDWSHLTINKLKDAVSPRLLNWITVSDEQTLIELRKK